jgi:hypothetical protein
MMKSQEFASGLGLDMHIRTTRVDTGRMSYSYISGTALKIGTDFLEVKDDGSATLNGEALLVGEHIGHFAGYPIKKSMKGSKKNIFVYELSLTRGNSIEIRVNTRSGMLFVDAEGNFSDDTVGLLGSPTNAILVGRDGKTDLTGEWNAFGEEWQVQSDEPKLFQDKNRGPQHPFGCIYEAQQTKRNVRRRRLTDYDNAGGSEIMNLELATKACADAAAHKKQFCVDDVMVTGDLELTEDPFYH